jgi:hypothetical protein
MVPALRRSHLRQATLPFTFIARPKVCHLNTRIHVRLLGPCFKTGQLRPFRQHPGIADGARTEWHAGSGAQLGSTSLPGTPAARNLARRDPRSIACLGPAHGICLRGQNLSEESHLPQCFVPRPEPMLTARRDSAPRSASRAAHEGLALPRTRRFTSHG